MNFSRRDDQGGIILIDRVRIADDRTLSSRTDAILTEDYNGTESRRRGKWKRLGRVKADRIESVRAKLVADGYKVTR